MSLARIHNLLRRARERAPREESDEELFATGFQQFRQTFRTGTARGKKKQSVFTIKVVCLDGPEYTEINSGIIRKMNDKNLGTETLKVGRHLTLNSLKQKFKDVFRLSCDFTLKKAQLNDASGKFLLTDILGVTVRDIKLECKRSKIYILPDEEISSEMETDEGLEGSNDRGLDLNLDVQLTRPRPRPRPQKSSSVKTLAVIANATADSVEESESDDLPDPCLTQQVEENQIVKNVKRAPQSGKQKRSLTHPVGAKPGLNIVSTPVHAQLITTDSRSSSTSQSQSGLNIVNTSVQAQSSTTDVQSPSASQRQKRKKKRSGTCTSGLNIVNTPVQALSSTADVQSPSTSQRQSGLNIVNTSVQAQSSSTDVQSPSASQRQSGLNIVSTPVRGQSIKTDSRSSSTSQSQQRNRRKALRRRPRAASKLARHQIREWCNRDTPLIEISEDDDETRSQINTDVTDLSASSSTLTRSFITGSLINNDGLSVESVRQEQDEAYAESLRQDQAKEQKRRKEEEEIRSEEQKLVNLRLMRKRFLPQEPENGGFILKIRGGQQRRFTGSDSKEMLMNFIGSQDQSTEHFMITVPSTGLKIPSWDVAGSLREVGLQASLDNCAFQQISEEEFMEEVNAIYEEVEQEDMFPNAKASNSTQTVDLCQALKSLALDVIQPNQEGDRLRIVVRRSSVLTDSLQNIRRAQMKLLRPLAVRFIGESAVDNGGPSRELSSELTMSFAASSFIEGDTYNKVFRKDFGLYDSLQYLYLGQLIAILLLQGGQGLPVFCHSVAYYIVYGNVPDTDNDLPESIQKSIEELTGKKGNEIMSSLDGLFPDRFEKGFTIPSSKMTDEHIPLLKKTLVAHHVIQKQQMALDQFIKGLEVGGVLGVLRQHPEQAYKLFKGAEADLSADLLESLITFEYSNIPRGSNLMLPAEGIEMGWIQLLQVAEAKEAVFNFGDNSHQISLADILQWMTGASRLPAIGMPSNVTVKFDSELLLPKMNTCALQVSIPIRMEFQDPEKFARQFAEWIINSQGYGLV